MLIEDQIVQTHPRSTARAARGWWITCLIVGSVAVIASLTNAWVPGPWLDEGVTLLAMERSWTSLFRMLNTMDAVHGLYYILMHAWGDIVGVTMFSARIPSGIAVGVATVVTMALGRVLVDRRTGVFAGLVFCFLPSVTWMGSEARSPAIATAATALTMLFLLAAMKRQRLGWWLAYGATLLFSLHIFMFTALVFMALPLIMLAGRQPRSQWVRFVASSGLVGLASLPLVVVCVSQRQQVSWIGEPTLLDAAESPVVVWFSGFGTSWPRVALILGLLAACIPWLYWALSRSPWWLKLGNQRSLAVATILAWMILPIALAFCVSWLGPNIYVDRYLMTTTPALALMLGLVARSVGRQAVVAPVILGLLFVPTWLAQRAPDCKLPTRAAAQIVDRIRLPSEAVLFLSDNSLIRALPGHSWTRLTSVVYPQSFVGLRDLNLGTRFEESLLTRESTVPLRSVPERLNQVNRIIVISPTEPSDMSRDDLAFLLERGFAPEHTERVTSRLGTWDVSIYVRRVPS